MRFTFDSNILVRALASPDGPALRLLDIILDAHTLVLSRFILDEVERVVLYPRLQARYHIDASEAARFTGNLAGVAHILFGAWHPRHDILLRWHQGKGGEESGRGGPAIFGGS